MTPEELAALLKLLGELRLRVERAEMAAEAWQRKYEETLQPPEAPE